MPGRPSRLTPRACQAIALAVSAGHYLQHAAAAAGVARSAVHSWLTRGRRARDRLDEGGDPGARRGAIPGLPRRAGRSREMRRRAGHRPNQRRDGRRELASGRLIPRRALPRPLAAWRRHGRPRPGRRRHSLRNRQGRRRRAPRKARADGRGCRGREEQERGRRAEARVPRYQGPARPTPEEQMPLRSGSG